MADGLREAVPLPRQREERLAAFEALWWSIACDVVATLDQLIEEGWPREAAIESLGTYRNWLVGNVDSAIIFGLGWWEATA